MVKTLREAGASMHGTGRIGLARGDRAFRIEGHHVQPGADAWRDCSQGAAPAITTFAKDHSEAVEDVAVGDG